MSEPFIGEIRLVGFNFPPRGWAFCDGQILPIAQNTALFSLLGTTYGGNGTTTFALPNLQGRVAMGTGNGHVPGESDGTERETLTVAQVPAHNHSLAASDLPQSTNKPSGALLTAGGYYASGIPDVTMSPQAIGGTGGDQSHNNLQPYLVLYYAIALQGIFPARD
ncbi:phage tail protein [Actinacidiphila oryziradicis]|uniref:Phage tail protein n=1 Tax=Actinacidiphila oryziradicis TaxID=2571141 RepID=A0A4U0T8A7_9ACTN|nr:tail fiber protein [Actinacidiphila oryziradicis]TKA10335.1 phage tail protein [Actinacidiphila oryziradicis]